jgi:hypothetical protein
MIWQYWFLTMTAVAVIGWLIIFNYVIYTQLTNLPLVTDLDVAKYRSASFVAKLHWILIALVFASTLCVLTYD